MYLDNYRDQLPPLCQKYHVKTLWVFGSVLTDRFRPDSDVDFIVDFEDGVDMGPWLSLFFEFRDSLENLLKRPVDLTFDQPFRNPIFRRSVENTKQLIYERAS
jgi:predicted nucleotidyltransferase